MSTNSVEANRTGYSINLLELVLSLTHCADLVSREVANHHKRVAYITGRLAVELGLPRAQVSDAVVAAAIHDVGAFSLQSRLDTLEFETSHPHQHAELGFRLAGRFEPFSGIARIIRGHHVHWSDGAGRTHNGWEVDELSHLLHLADRIDVLLTDESRILSEIGRIRDRIIEGSGSRFRPEFVDAFVQLSGMESFWLDSVSLDINDVIRLQVPAEVLDLDSSSAVELARLLSHIVDFKSPFTSAHTSGVAPVAHCLARLAGFDAADCERMLIAGYLHDLGKLAVPAEILDKPAPLTRNEAAVMRSHTYYTRRILGRLNGFAEITEWAANHHESLNGTGYPYHVGSEELDRGSRLMAVADVFVALRENRPYRAGMDGIKAMEIMHKMVEVGKLDRELVGLLNDNFDRIDELRRDSQLHSVEAYSEIICDLPR